MKFSIGTKLWGGFLSILVVLIVLGMSAYQNTMKLTETARWMAHSHDVLIQLTGLLSSLQDAETGQRGYLITGEEHYLEPYQAASRRVDAQIHQIKEMTADNPAQQRRIDALGSLVAEKMSELGETIDLRRSKGFEAARQIVLTDEGKKVMDQVRATMGEMETQEKELLKARNEEATSSSRYTVNTVMFGILLASALVIAAAFFLTRHISAPLKDVTDMAEKIGAGDLMVNLSMNGRTDEVGKLTQVFGRMTAYLKETAEVADSIAGGDLRVTVKPQSEKDLLGNAFATMVHSLRRTTTELTEGANVLASSASEILVATTQLASSAAETASAISETTTTVEEVKQTGHLSSQKAKNVLESSQKATEVARIGRNSVETAVAGMKRIQAQMESIAESIVRLSEQSQTIGEIIASVNDLADQSNLLAVNAAIEAAKAGEQGKGFAVVAQEIRSLAEQSKQATAQVRNILSEIQKATTAAVMATEQGSKAVESGVQQSVEAGESIRALADTIAEAAQAATQIAASSQQQLVGTDQVALAMENIRQGSTQNAAGTKQAETAAHNLHELGQKFKQLVEQYRV